MSETKHTPTAGATRAAKALHLAGYTSFAGESAEVRIAEIIDREAKLPELLADSKKLREPATCNAGHKSNLPLALWDCPVCTQLLRDKLKMVEELVTVVKEYTEHAAKPPWESGPFDHDFWLVRAGKVIREVEAALGGKAE